MTLPWERSLALQHCIKALGMEPFPLWVHGAPTTAAESREVLARLKRMAGFESQDFDPAVRLILSRATLRQSSTQRQALTKRLHPGQG